MTMGYNYCTKFIDSLQAMGRYSFSYEEIAKEFDLGYDSIRQALNRLTRKKRIVLVTAKFYVIVPPEYSARGILPPHLFVDDLMRFLNKPYYVSLQSAAALHGAAHQQPQVFQVMTVKPTRRPVHVKGLRIEFYYKSEFPVSGIAEQKSNTGTIRVSDPALTAIDLILFERRVGGLIRVVEILEELIDRIHPEQFEDVLRDRLPVSALQRLGFVFDRILGHEALSSCVESVLRDRILYRIPLETSMAKTGQPVDPKWKVIVNSDLKTKKNI